jgi:hypothetical protein
MTTTVKKVSLKCICGGKYQKNQKKSHEKTNKHQHYVEFGKQKVKSFEKMYWQHTKLTELDEEHQKRKREYQHQYYKKHYIPRGDKSPIEV